MNYFGSYTQAPDEFGDTVEVQLIDAWNDTAEFTFPAPPPPAAPAKPAPR